MLLIKVNFAVTEGGLFSSIYSKWKNRFPLKIDTLYNRIKLIPMF